MKIIFLLDDKGYVEITPDQLKLNRREDGATLGVDITITKEDGSTEAGFYSLVEFNNPVPTESNEPVPLQL